MRIIPRRIDLERLEKAKPWMMIYGRRKTGKSFLVENFLNYDKFFFVCRDSTVLDKFRMEKYTWSEFFKVFKEIIGSSRIVIDEFHRLPVEFLDYLHSIGVRGELILITSTLWFTRKLLGKGSPIIGLVYPVRIGLIDERDILNYLSKEFKGKDLIEACVYLREPFLIPMFKPPIHEFISSFIYEWRILVKELIGEIFTEEERELTGIYDGILKAIANGKNVSTEISTFLFSRNLIAKDNPGVVQKYLEILTGMGIIEKNRVFGKRKFRYSHQSPIFDLYYYLEEKYSYTELEIPIEFIKKVVESKIPHHVEQFFRSLLSKVFGLKPEIVENEEIDIALLRYKKLEVIGEVKWKSFIDKGEIRKIEERLERINAKRILIVPSIRSLEREPENIDVLDVDEILKLVKQYS